MMTTYEDNVMVNQINNLNNGKIINNGANNDNQAVQKDDEAKKAQASSDDSISLSETAKKLDGLKTLVEESPEIDEKRVEEIKNQLKQGKLEISSEAISKKILEDFIE
jgi:negative regulator of flagellin synthesis FlgM